MMSIAILDEDEREIVFSCLKAVASGELLADWELAGRIGLESRELRELIMRWPRVDDSRDDSQACLAINNCLNEICHGVAIPNRQWQRWFQADKAAVKAVYQKWAAARGWDHTGVR